MDSQPTKGQIATDSIELSDLVGQLVIEDMFLRYMRENSHLKTVFVAEFNGYKLLGFPHYNSPNGIEATFILVGPTGIMERYTHTLDYNLAEQYKEFVQGDVGTSEISFDN